MGPSRGSPGRPTGPEPATLWLKREADRFSHRHGTPFHFLAMGPSFPCWFLLFSSSSLPLLPFFFISSPTMELISSIFFGQVELRGSHTLLFSVSSPSQSPFLSGLHEYIYMDRIKKSTLISPFSHFPHLVSQKPTELKLGTPHPQNTVHCLSVVCATVTDTVFSCTHRCLLGVSTAHFI